MRLKNLLIGTLVLILILVGYVFMEFRAWLGDQPEELDIIQLVDNINSERQRLSNLVCSPELIDDLESLLDAQEQYYSTLEMSEQSDFYFDLIMSHAKLGYLYELSGQNELSERHYSEAQSIGRLVNDLFENDGYVKRIAIDSSLGCISQ